jgi:nucleotide-binding universal stress UspA family protein
MLKKILVAYNKAEAGEQAFLYALELAKPFQAAVSVLAVAWPSGAPTALEMAGLMESDTEHLERGFPGMQEIAKANDVSLGTKAVVGHPARQIVREAVAQGADLIVMSDRGSDWIERWLARSIAKRVLGRAPCAVAIAQ